MNDAISIRNRILRGLALNRTPGYHFTGNFLSLSFEKNTEQEARLSMAAGPHNIEPNGNVSYGALAVLADIALAANVRAGHTPASRLATVQMNLQFTGAPITGRLQAVSGLQTYVQDITSVQGAGQVFGEHVVYDRGSGQPLAASFMDYAMPRAGLIPEVRGDEHPTPSKISPLGVKGVGESGCTASIPVLVAAVLDALRPLGITHLDMPLTPAKVWQAISAARAKS